MYELWLKLRFEFAMLLWRLRGGKVKEVEEVAHGDWPASDD